jgi:hypothetical protein
MSEIYWQLMQDILPEQTTILLMNYPDGSQEPSFVATGNIQELRVGSQSGGYELISAHVDPQTWRVEWTIDYLKGNLLRESKALIPATRRKFLRSTWLKLHALILQDTSLSEDLRKHLLWKMKYAEQFF